MRKVVVAFVVCVLAVIPALAQPLADRVPTGAIFYLGWSGSENLGPSYADSHTKALVDESNLPEVFNSMFPRAIARIALESPETAEVLRAIQSVSGPMWRHPCAMFLADVDVSGRTPMPRAGVICRAGADAQALLTRLQALVEQAHECPAPLRAYQSGDLVAFTVGYPEGEDPIGSAKTLVTDSSFTGALTRVQKDGVLTVYINFERIWTLIDQSVDASSNAELKNYWPKIRDASGLAGMKRLIATGAFDGKDWMEQAFVEVASPRAGLLTLLNSQPLSDELLKLVPADADQMLAGSCDLAAMLGAIRAGIAQIDPEAGQMAEKVIGAISLYIGKDFQKDVLDPLGEQWLCYSSPTIAGRGILGAVLINATDDPAKAQSGLIATQIATFNTIAPFLQRYKITLRAQNIKTDGLSIHYLAIPLVSPAWAIHGKYLYAGWYPQTIISASRFSSSGGKSILDNPSFTELRKRLAAPSNLSGVSYLDLEQTIGEGYQAMVAVSRAVLGMGDLFGVKSPEPVIPPLDTLLKHIGPCGSVSWMDDAGWHSRSVAPFPGATMLRGGNNTFVNMIIQAVGAGAGAFADK